jgi:hypothetical protein
MTNEATLTETKKGISSVSKDKPVQIKPGTGISSNMAGGQHSSYQPYQGPKIVVTKK